MSCQVKRVKDSLVELNAWASVFLHDRVGQLKKDNIALLKGNEELQRGNHEILVNTKELKKDNQHLRSANEHLLRGNSEILNNTEELRKENEQLKFANEDLAAESQGDEVSFGS